MVILFWLLMVILLIDIGDYFKLYYDFGGYYILNYFENKS